MSISMREIAKLAGVSNATVSRVIHRSDLVAEETARRIQRIIQDLNFVPNFSAAHLKSGKSQVYCIIVPDLCNPFFTEVVKFLEGLLADNEQELLVANTDSQSARMHRTVHRMLLRRVDGVALLTSELDATTLASLVQNQIPVVTTNHRRVANGLSDIMIDLAGGMAQMLTHLKELGHRRVGFIGGKAGVTTSRVRRESFLEAIVKQGLSSREGWMVEGNSRIEGGSTAMARILSLPEIPTAVVAANDLTAIGALQAARKQGLRVPEDLSIAGCDDIEMSDIVVPALTTLRISRKEYARLVFEALQETGRDLTQPGRQFDLSTHLVVRQSTGPAPGH